MKDGLTLLLLFAFGPLKGQICGSPSFTKRVQKYLQGDFYQRVKIEKAIPQQLKTAWPKLQKIAKKNKTNPLSLDTVSTYIFKKHNQFAKPSCRIKTGIVQKINEKRKILLVKTNAGISKIKFLNPYAEDIKIGDYITFHHDWLITKLMN